MKKLFIALCTIFMLVGCAQKEVADQVENGDVVNLDFVGTFKGVEFEGGNTNGEGYDLKIGSHSFVDDFEEQLIGMKVGDTKTITVTFPDPYVYNPDLAGQDVQFKVTINEINR